MSFNSETLQNCLTNIAPRFKSEFLPFLSNDLFINAIINATNDEEQANAIDNYINFLHENFTNTELAIEYLQEEKSKLSIGNKKLKKIIINFNGTGCPAYLDSVHDRYLIENLGKEDIGILNIPGVGIDATKSIASNIYDVAYGNSAPHRMQQALDFIREYAAEDCAIELFGHSRGAVAAIVVGRIISQRYPNIKIIAHDPVPGNTSIPLIQPSYFNKELDVAHFIQDATTPLSIQSILENEDLRIRGALVVPFRRDDKRAAFALLDGTHAYDADQFYPLEMPGFHSIGLTDYTSIDYSVYWENLPLIGPMLRTKNKKANQGNEVVDNERNQLKMLSRKHYQQIVDLFTNESFSQNDNNQNSTFQNELAKKRAEMLHEFTELGVLHSEIQNNPVYHAKQDIGPRPIPDALDQIEDLDIYDAFFYYLKTRTNSEGKYIPYSGTELQELINKLVYTPNDINDCDLLYLLVYWINGVAKGNQSTIPTIVLENIHYNLSSNSDFSARVQVIAGISGLDKIYDRINQWKSANSAYEIASDIRQAAQSCPNGPTKDLWLNFSDSLEGNNNVEEILNTHQHNNGPQHIASLTQKVSDRQKLKKFASISFILGIIIGVSLVATGVLAPFGVGILGAIAFAAISGASFTVAGAILGLGYVKATKRSLHIPVNEIIHQDSATKSLAKLGGNQSIEVEQQAPVNSHTLFQDNTNLSKSPTPSSQFDDTPENQPTSTVDKSR